MADAAYELWPLVILNTALLGAQFPLLRERGAVIDRAGHRPVYYPT